MILMVVVYKHVKYINTHVQFIVVRNVCEYRNDET